MKTLVVIPARYESSRFPGKPLAEVLGKSMIEHVCNRVRESGVANRLVVATDDTRILDHVNKLGYEAMMTSEMHQSGTDRCGEVEMRLKQEGEKFDIVINVQGDEPGLPPQNLVELTSAFKDDEVKIATLITACLQEGEIEKSSIVKVVIDKNDDALYFSRFAIPFMRDKKHEGCFFYRHHGIYAFRSGVLEQLTALPQSMLEKAESLEQLRWMENSWKLRTVSVLESGIGIDVPEDIGNFERNHSVDQEDVEG